MCVLWFLQRLSTPKDCSLVIVVLGFGILLNGCNKRVAMESNSNELVINETLKENMSMSPVSNFFVVVATRHCRSQVLPSPSFWKEPVFRRFAGKDKCAAVQFTCGLVEGHTRPATIRESRCRGSCASVSQVDTRCGH